MVYEETPINYRGRNKKNETKYQKLKYFKL
jgi:hypothetical protein